MVLSQLIPDCVLKTLHKDLHTNKSNKNLATLLKTKIMAILKTAFNELERWPYNSVSKRITYKNIKKVFTYYKNDIIFTSKT